MNIVKMVSKTDGAAESWPDMQNRHFREKVSAVESLARADLTISEVASSLGVPGHVVSNFCRYHNLDISFKSHPNYKKPDLQVLIDRIALSKTGLTTREAADKIGITVGALRLYSARYNIKWKPASSWK